MSKTSILSLGRRDILDIYKCAVDAVRPEHIMRKILNIEGDTLRIRDCVGQKNEVSVDLKRSRIHVIGGGKSVLGMAKGLAEMAKLGNVTHLFSHGALSLPVGSKSNIRDEHTNDLLNSIRIKCFFGSHNNLPDNDSIKASEAILDGITAACQEDQLEGLKPIFIVLISGGGSACLTKPKHIDLEKKLEIIRFLVQKGADIITLNKVRRYFSSIKGGQLAYHILKSHTQSKVLTLILSDVIGDNIEFIASGPTFVSEKNSSSECRQSMLDVLDKYGYREIEKFPEDIISDLDLVDANEDNINNLIIGNNELALQAAALRATELGYNVKCLGNNLQGPSEGIVREIYANSREISATNIAETKFLVLAGGEATIDKLEGHGWGIGGRAQEMALDYMMIRMLEQSDKSPANLEDVFLAAGTDGQDGPTDVAGCLASFSENQRTSTFSRNHVVQAKFHHDSNAFWTRHKPEWLIRTGLTGTNVMDLYMCLMHRRVD